MHRTDVQKNSFSLGRMAEAEVNGTEQEGFVTLEEKQPATEETCVRVFYASRGKQENDSHSVTRPLLQHRRQDSRDENYKADTRAATDGADRQASVPRELPLAGGDEPGRGGSVRSLCSDSSRHECPICSELLDLPVTLLNCDHTLCHRCTAGIMRRARDQSRLQCPFCRQTTPFPQWEIRRLQEESYSSGVYEPGPALVVGPGPELPVVPPSSLCYGVTCGCCVYPLTRQHFLFFAIATLLFLVLLCCFLYMVVPVVILFSSR